MKTKKLFFPSRQNQDNNLNLSTKEYGDTSVKTEQTTVSAAVGPIDKIKYKLDAPPLVHHTPAGTRSNTLYGQSEKKAVQQTKGGERSRHYEQALSERSRQRLPDNHAAKVGVGSHQLQDTQPFFDAGSEADRRKHTDEADEQDKPVEGKIPILVSIMVEGSKGYLHHTIVPFHQVAFRLVGTSLHRTHDPGETRVADFMQTATVIGTNYDLDHARSFANHLPTGQTLQPYVEIRRYQRHIGCLLSQWKATIGHRYPRCVKQTSTFHDSLSPRDDMSILRDYTCPCHGLRWHHAPLSVTVSSRTRRSRRAREAQLAVESAANTRDNKLMLPEKPPVQKQAEHEKGERGDYSRLPATTFDYLRLPATTCDNLRQLPTNCDSKGCSRQISHGNASTAPLCFMAERNEEIWAAHNSQILRADEDKEMGVYSSAGIQGWGKRSILEKFHRPAASSATIPTSENPGATRPCIEPCSPRARSEGAIRATLTRTPSASSLLRQGVQCFRQWKLMRGAVEEERLEEPEVSEKEKRGGGGCKGGRGYSGKVVRLCKGYRWNFASAILRHQFTFLY
ncbi:hypothetical protein PR048_017975 [Dryococelus australis]|uniref:Uncharacterized protein n=1 Tax=Dryococelus australis TaxID=614101 RepID=A0ABQ9HB50_9NEOP|nr:hypothetical protein PR048_017975 [Dryococelus australis]